jgi:hypothetical protein
MVRIRTVEALPGHRLRLGLTDGRTIERDLSGRLFGPVFAEIREDPALFSQVRVDYGTVGWPNGADLDPDMLIWGGLAPETVDNSPTNRPDDGDVAGSPVQPNR